MPLWTNVDEEAGKPKYLTAADKANTYGVDEGETQQAKGIDAGWVLYTTYTDSEGNTRHKSETLVAMSTITGDAADDALLPDRTIAITTQPQNVTTVTGETVTFTVVASATPAANLTYQWQVDVGGVGTWADVDGETAVSYTFEAAIGDDTNQYRVVVSANQAADVTSDAATLAVTA